VWRLPGISSQVGGVGFACASYGSFASPGGPDLGDAVAGKPGCRRIGLVPGDVEQAAAAFCLLTVIGSGFFGGG